MGRDSIIKSTKDAKVSHANFGGDGNARAIMNMASQVISRAALATQLGKSYDGERDIYTALGYNKDLTYSNYYARYERQDIAKRVVSAPVSSSWRKKPVVTELKKDETIFMKAWKGMVEDSKIFHYLYRADLISGIGSYGVLLMGFDDGNDLSQPVETANNLLFLRPYSEVNAEINRWEEDPTKERYGKPILYTLKSAQANRGGLTSLDVHYSRVIHLAEGNEEDEIYGVPRMRSVYNRLQDLELVSGGSAEMFWRGAFPGMGFTADADTQWDPQTLTDMRTEIESYMHNMQRYLRLKGVEINELKSQVSDPSNHVSVLLDLISGATGIPKRILIGSERGELASSQDESNWNSRIEERRLDYVEPTVLRPFIDKQIEVGTLPPPADGYTVEWPPLTSPDMKDEAEITKLKVEAITKYASTPGADILIPPDFFYRKFLNFTDDEIDQIEIQMDSMLAEERAQLDDDRAALEKERQSEFESEEDDG